MYEGNIVISKSVPEPINWNTHPGWFPQARPIPFLDAVNLVKTNQSNVSEISLVGKVFRRWPFYHDITGGCGKRGGDRRLRFLLTDDLSNDSVRFYVTCFGRYAEEIEEAGILENETVEIWKPYITLKRWQPGEKHGDDICDYELWFGLDDEDINVNYEKRIVIYKCVPENSATIEVNISPNYQNKEKETTPQEQNNRKQKAVSVDDISKKTFAEIANMKKRCPISSNEVEEYENNRYSTISECTSVEKSVKYNLYAIVTNIKRAPTPTRMLKLMSQIYVTDPSCEGSYGHSDFQFSLLGHKLEDFPKMVIGSIIRIHHMAVQIWQGFHNGRVFDARSVTVIGHTEILLPNMDEHNTILNKRDKNKVQELKDWWAKEGKEKQSQSEEMNEHKDQLQFCDISATTKVFNTACTVIEQIGTKTPRCKILRVSDSTKSSIPMVFLDPDGSTLKTEVGRDMQDIFVTEHLDLLRLAKVGKKVGLKGVQCVLFHTGGQNNLSYKLVINSDVKADCHIISNTRQSMHNKDDLELMEDSEFDKMLANAIHLPDTEEESSAGVMGPSSGFIGKSSTNAQLERGIIHPQSKKDKNLNQTDSAEEKEDDCDISIPALPSNSGALVLRPCTITDESTNMDDDSIGERNKQLVNDEAQETTNNKHAARLHSIRSNIPITTDVSFEALFQLEKSMCSSTENCRTINDNVSRNISHPVIENISDSMQAIAGSQDLLNSEDVEPHLHDSSDNIPPSIHSPSPTTINTFVIRSSSNFPLVPLSEVSNKKASETFRIIGNIREFQPNISRCYNNLVLLHALCEQCCTSTPLLKFEQFKGRNENSITESPACENCNEELKIYIYFKAVVSDNKMPQPLPMPDSADTTCELIVEGRHAEYLLGITAQNFFMCKDVQSQAIERLASLIDHSVELSVVVVEDTSRREYHIVNSYITSDTEEHYL